ncbi:hypothetical protein VTN77DRAFT_4364 [Rasamsonia byssochlamydoides]|uniref:uncharacterized protein n=1 Tax=Rasamsonia byssochlamydoides TaxID=89139 RepID=UPI003742BF27
MQRKKPTLPVRQLTILSICRFAEPVVFTSVLPYLPEMMEFVGVPKNEVAKWVGISSAVVAGCQCIMGVPWGTFSDYVGRKPSILLGLTFTMIFSLVFGFSQSLTMLIVSRAFLGLMNGNVGIIRTMVAEMVPERELQPRAFSLMPLVWTIGSIFGPAFGGALANPAVKHPDIFGGSEFLRKYPFALPNMLSAALFIVGITTGILFLEETLETRKDKRDYGLILGRMLTSSCTRKHDRLAKHDPDETTALLNSDEPDLEGVPPTPAKRTQSKKKKPRKRPSLKQVFTPQSNLVLLAYGMMALHSMAFDSLFPVFLHHPEQQLDGNPDVKLPFKFASGFGVDSQTIGILYTLIGIIGMFIQFLVFPAVARRYGVLYTFRVVVVAYPLLYLVTPFTVLVPASLRNVTVFTLMLAKLACVIFSFPCSTILLTNTASSLRILGTLNGVGVSISAIGRAVGPAIVGSAFTFGVKRGYMIVPWWILTLLGALSALPAFWVVETDGFVPGKEDDTDEEEQPAEERNG